jgi:hypothetical protein
METSFYSQNTGRFYPFDEDNVQSHRAENEAKYGAQAMELIQKGIVDMGMVVMTGDSRTEPIITYCRISKSGDVFTVAIYADCEYFVKNSTHTENPGELDPLGGWADPSLSVEIDSYFLEFQFTALQLTDYITLKANDETHCYGYLTIGIASLWTKPDIIPASVPCLEFPVHRTCVKWLNRQLTSLEVLNEDRYLPDDRCLPDLIRPEMWSYGYVLPGDIILRAGYNCEIQFSEADNTIWFYPVAYGGLGKVAEHLPLGFQFIAGQGWTKEPQISPDRRRYDWIDTSIAFASSVAEAYGNEILVETDGNFRVEAFCDDSVYVADPFCGAHCLYIECLYTQDACPPMGVLENPPCIEE